MLIYVIAHYANSRGDITQYANSRCDITYANSRDDITHYANLCGDVMSIVRVFRHNRLILC